MSECAVSDNIVSVDKRVTVNVRTEEVGHRLIGSHGDVVDIERSVIPPRRETANILVSCRSKLERHRLELINALRIFACNAEGVGSVDGVMSESDVYESVRLDLMRYATALVGRNTAEDVVSTVVTRVLARPGGLGGLRDPKQYLMRSILNEVRTRHRQRARQPIVRVGFPAELSLEPGTHTVTITATNDAGKFSTEEITVIVDPNLQVEFGFISDISEEPDGTWTLTSDHAEWLTGEEARIAAIEDGELPEGAYLSNDFYIRNNDAATSQFSVRSATIITLQAYWAGGGAPGIIEEVVDAGTLGMLMGNP